MIFAASFDGLIILGIIVGVVGVLGIIAFVIYRLTHPKLKTKDKPNDEDVVKEEMERMLKPIEDDKVNEEINNYKQDE